MSNAAAELGRIGGSRSTPAKRRASRRNGAKGGRPKSKTGEKVLEIRSRYSAGGVFQKQLAKEFGISSSMVRFIVRRKNWKHI
jgi:hypothetical protein